jgi:hypothetical protein
MPDPHLRAADSDREAVAGVLGRALSEGRLTVDEYEDRLTRAYAARTYGDLDGLTTDLPVTGASSRPAAGSAAWPPPRPMTPTPSTPSTPSTAPGHPGPYGPWARGGRAVWASWLSTALIVTVIWLATSIGSHDVQSFWPIWVIGPWGAVLLARTLTGQHHRSGRRRR